LRATTLAFLRSLAKPSCTRTMATTSRIARRGKDSSRRLGRHRWVIERTLAWLSSYRRLTIRYERRADLHEAVLYLACALVCFGRWIRRGEVV
jgi:transposase